MLSNLLNTLSFGATIQSGGKQYSVVMRLSDRLFVVTEPNQPLPTQLMLCQADIQMQRPGRGAGGMAGVGAAPALTGPGPSPKVPGDKPLEKEVPKDSPKKGDKAPENNQEKRDAVH